MGDHHDAPPRMRGHRRVDGVLHPMDHSSGTFLEFDLAGHIARAGLGQPGIGLDPVAERCGGLQRATMWTAIDGVDLKRFQPVRQPFRLVTAQGAQRWIGNLLEIVVDIGVPNEPDLGDALHANQVRVLERPHRPDDVVSTCQARADRAG